MFISHYYPYFSSSLPKGRTGKYKLINTYSKIKIFDYYKCLHPEMISFNILVYMFLLSFYANYTHTCIHICI